MKYLITIVLVICIVLADASNRDKGIFNYDYDAKKAQRIHFKFEFGYANNRSQLIGLDHFFTSYNNFFKDYLTQPFQTTRLGPAPYVALGFGSRYFTMQVNYTYYDQHASSNLIGGEGREYRLVLNSMNIEWDFVVPWKFPLTFGFTIGGNIDKGRLYSAYRYADGSLSYGSDKQLNGIYRIKATGNCFGMKMVWQTNWGDIYLRGEYYDIDLSGTNLGIKDIHHGYSVHTTNYVPSLYHPDDIEKSNDMGVYYVGRNSIINSDFRGKRYTLGLTFYLMGK